MVASAAAEGPSSSPGPALATAVLAREDGAALGTHSSPIEFGCPP